MKMFSRKEKVALAAAVAAWIASSPLTVYAQDWTYNGDSVTTSKYHVIGSPDQAIDNNHIVINDINLSAAQFGLVSGVASGKVSSLKNNTITIYDGTFHYGRIFNNILMQERVPVGVGYGNDIIINGGTFYRDKDTPSDGGGYGIQTYAGDIIVNGGNFAGGHFHFDTVGKVEIHDGTFNEIYGIDANEIEVTGGTFSDGYYNGGSMGTEKYFRVGLPSEWKHYGSGTIMDKYSISITGGTFNAGIEFQGCSTGTDYQHIIDRTLTVKDVEIPYIFFSSPNNANFTDVTFENVKTRSVSSGFAINVDNISVKDSDFSGSTWFYVNKDLTFKDSTSAGEITFGENLVFDNSTHDCGEDTKIFIKNNENTPKTLTLKNGSHVTGTIDHTYSSDAKTTLSMTESSVFTGDISTRSDMLVDMKDGSKLDGNLLIKTYSRSANDQLKVDSSEITGNVSIDSGFDLNNAHIGGTFEAFKYSGLAVEDKTLRIKDSTIDGAAGIITKGNSTSKIENTTLNISGSTFGDFLSLFTATNVNNSTINITDSSVTGDIVGFIAGGNVTSNGMTNNTMTIEEGTTIGGNVYLANAYKSIDNTLNLYTMNGLTADTLISGNKYTSTGNMSGNTLNIKNVLGATAKNIEKFQNVNIYVPSTASAGDTVLTLTDENGTNLNGATVKAGIEGDIDFDTGDKIYLLTNANGISTSGTTYGTLTSGVSTIYTGLAVKKDGDNSIILTIPANNTPDPDPDPDPDPPIPDPDPDPPIPDPDPLPPVIPINPPVMRRINPETQSLLSGQIASTEIVEEAVEIADAVRDADIGDNIFGVISAAAIRGNDVSSKNTHFAVGYKRADEERIAAAYVQYGRGSYSSDIQGIDASGNTDYVGIGGYYKQALPSDTYIDAGLNVGQVNRDYSGKGFSTVIDSTSHEKEKTPYIGGFVRFGKEWSVFREDPEDEEPLFKEEKARYGAYLKLSAEHIAGYDTTLSSGERYSFDDTAKTGVTVGATYSQKIDAKNTVSADLGITQSFGNVGASFRNGDIEGIDLNGISAALSVAWKQEIDDRQSVDLRVRGIAGARSGGDIAVTYNMIF